MSQPQSVTATFTRKPPPACIVPKLQGKSVEAAKRALAKAHCRAGKIGKKFSKAKKGRVVSQKPKPHKHLRAGAKVAFVVSKGEKR